MSWWDSKWRARHAIHSQTDGDAYTSGLHYLHVDIDLDGLVANGLLRNDFKDLRVIYQSGATFINTPYLVASGREPERIYFPAQNDMPGGIDIGGHGSGWGYYLYFGYDDGDTSGLSPAYVNRNFPQAPYSITTNWYQPAGATSGYRDKCLYRFNDDPSIGSQSGFEDATGFTSGVIIYAGGDTSGVYKGKDGRLDLATEFTQSQRGALLVLDDNDGTTVPSGDWCVDFWVYPYPNASLGFWFSKKDNANSSNYNDWIVYVRETYDSADDGYNQWATQKSSASTVVYNSYNKTSSEGIAENEWSHLRLYYGKKYFGAWTCLYCYHNGVRKGTTGNCAWINEPYRTQMESGNCVIGGGLHPTTTYEIDGKLEQFRYSTYPWFAQLDYNPLAGNSRYAPPDWINNEYTLYLSNIQLYSPTLSGLFGGYTSATTDFIFASGLYGGYTFGAVLGSGVFGGISFARLAITSLFGGYAASLRGTITASFGGFLLGFAPAGGICVFGAVTSGVGIDNITNFGGFANAQHRTWKANSLGGNTLGYAGSTQESFRGFTIGTWTSPDTIVENGARSLVKSLADTQHRQKFTIDGDITLYANQTSEFDSAVEIINKQPDEFDSLLLVQKTHRNPFIKIIDTNITGSEPWVVTILASGYAFNKDGIIINSGIHHAAIDWTDGDYTILTNTTASGALFQFVHSYTASGLYKSIVSVQDKFGRHGADDTTINLASGLSLPYIKLLAVPRLGGTPPPFYAEIGAVLSGVQDPYNLFWDYGNGIRFYNNATSGTAQYALPGDYIPYVRIKDARQIFVVDTLRVGFNQ
jgi:hypothetical protein